MTIQKSTVTYQGVTVECAKITADKARTWRFSKTLNFDGNYAWQFVIKADADTQVDVTVGNQTETFDVSTSFELLSHSFKNVEASNYPYVEINFPIGVFYIYHTQLEYGNEPTEYNPSGGGVEQDIYDLKKEVKAIENSLGTLASKNAINVSTTSNLAETSQTYTTSGSNVPADQTSMLAFGGSNVRIPKGRSLVTMRVSAFSSDINFDRLRVKCSLNNTDSNVTIPVYDTGSGYQADESKLFLIDLSAVANMVTFEIIPVGAMADINIELEYIPLSITSTNTISYS